MSAEELLGTLKELAELEGAFDDWDFEDLELLYRLAKRLKDVTRSMITNHIEQEITP